MGEGEDELFVSDEPEDITCSGGITIPGLGVGMPAPETVGEDDDGTVSPGV